jgi:hypothetical protein
MRQTQEIWLVPRDKRRTSGRYPSSTPATATITLNAKRIEPAAHSEFAKFTHLGTIRHARYGMREPRASGEACLRASIDVLIADTRARCFNRQDGYLWPFFTPPSSQHSLALARLNGIENHMMAESDPSSDGPPEFRQ